MPDVNLNTFPYSKTTALTMLYLEQQDLSDLTPSQLVDKYKKVYKEINSRFSEDNSAKSFSF
ncbi:hypothetical protein MPH47_04330 [Psychrobacillus psychrodurans]|uniref:hypothetical protein n=1 Tax=Psychrobacillus psychrodurans TaxID=126157 RepID=UPI001F4E9FE6|nr:hypothetical protein [Psychrobacillus psychrodurans]MCK1996473.1 hypothetical protein [Psychrobacillus psychrodurans]